MTETSSLSDATMRSMGRENLGQFVRDYLQRVVNQHDMSALDDMVSPDYRGNGLGWPPDIGSLREFYQWQQRWRPDWHIDVRCRGGSG